MPDIQYVLLLSSISLSRLTYSCRTVELTEEDTLLILACDGVWDVLSNEQAVAIAEAQPTAARAAIALRGMLHASTISCRSFFLNARVRFADAAYCMGSTDNVSVVVIRFNDLPLD